MTCAMTWGGWLELAGETLRKSERNHQKAREVARMPKNVLDENYAGTMLELCWNILVEDVLVENIPAKCL